MKMWAKLAVAGYLGVAGYQFHKGVTNNGGTSTAGVAKTLFLNEKWLLLTGALVAAIVLFGETGK